MIVVAEINIDECINILILHLVEVLHHLAERAVIHMIAHYLFCSHFVSVCHGHIVHLVAEAEDKHVLRVGPGCADAFPYSDVLLGFGVFPISDNKFTAYAHA